jgi:hypothetical protein
VISLSQVSVRMQQKSVLIVFQYQLFEAALALWIFKYNCLSMQSISVSQPIACGSIYASMQILASVVVYILYVLYVIT